MSCKKTRLTVPDVEEFFIAACETDVDVPNIGDPARPLVIDPFRAAERFIKTFTEPHARGTMLNHLVQLHRGMQPKGGGISDTD